MDVKLALDTRELHALPRVTIAFLQPADGHRGYLGATSSFPAQPGETWRRGSDLADGPADLQTLEKIFADIRRTFGL